jgi:radical SAM superfamily enzyme YgiQ (UPF0313 family)
MRVLLVSANTEKINMPTMPMGLGSIAAAAAAAGHAVRLLDLMAVSSWRRLLETALAEAPPDVIGISIRNIDDQVSEQARFLLAEAREVVAFCRTVSDAPLVLGGAGYSIFPGPVLDYTDADMGIQGEGETAFCLLLERLSASRPVTDVPGLYVRGRGLQAPRLFERDLDRLPLPGPEWFDARYADDPDYFVPFQTRRGCPLSCTYCSTATIEGALIRKRSPAAVVAGLARWRAAGFTRYFFVDNVFNLPEGYALDLCNGIAAAGLDIHWRCILYPGKIRAALVRAMARAGCKSVAYGFESGSAALLAALGKQFTLDEIVTGSRMLAEAGLERMGFLLLGGPGETRDTVRQSLAFADSLDLDALKLTIGIRIYPDTALARIAAREGAIPKDINLLEPRFYLAPGLEKWLRETVADWMAGRPNWML